jgi:hypothetical protein
VAGCRQEETEYPLCDAGRYFPLEEGTWWTYRNYRVMEDGSEEEVGTDSLTISGDTLMLGYHYYKLEGIFHSRTFSHWITENEGKIEGSDGCIFFRCPQLVESDHLYPVYHFDFPAMITSQRADTTIRVPAGEFKRVIHMEAVSMLNDSVPLVTYRFWFARDIGLIRWTARCTDCRTLLVSELSTIR